MHGTQYKNNMNDNCGIKKINFCDPSDDPSSDGTNEGNYKRPKVGEKQYSKLYKINMRSN